MKIVTNNKQNEKLFVEIAANSTAYKFPTKKLEDGTVVIDMPLRTTDKLEQMVQIPVTYGDLEPDDVTIADDVLEWYAKVGMNAEDVVDAMRKGLRLAVGDLAKAPYKAEGGKKLLATAKDWLINQPIEKLIESKTIPVDKRDEWILEQYKNR